jgi:hypothetical protein
MHSESEFYVGYSPMPAGLKRTIRRVVTALGGLVLGVAALLIVAQHPFADATFEFQNYREFRGSLVAEPYPTLAIPGQGLPWLLVGPGKHGVGDMRSLDGREVRLTGERVIHGDDHMIELQRTLLPSGPASAPLPSRDREGAVANVQLTGEVVDSKCYFGVMNPGAGKVHRDCAVRCISGGIPPAFLVRDSSGNTATLLLANWSRDLLQHIAEPVTIRGRLVRSSGRLILYQE